MQWIMQWIMGLGLRPLIADHAAVRVVEHEAETRDPLHDPLVVGA